MSKPPLLVFGWGNLARGDDGLGPLFVGEAARRDDTEFIVDYQLQPEHALDMTGRARVLFVDATAQGTEPFQLEDVMPDERASFTTHHLSPAALLQVFVKVIGQAPPPTQLLTIRGWDFGLGESLSARARENLDAALAWWASRG